MAEPQRFIGPIYCETGHPWLVAEPVNTWSTLVIILMGVMAAVHIWRNYKKPPVDAVILVIMLIGVGIGSFWWHGWRTRLALNFDVVPGLLFLFLFVTFWIRRLQGAWAGLTALFAVPILIMGGIYLGRFVMGEIIVRPSPLFLLPTFGTIAVLGAFFVWLTYRKRGPAMARHAGIILGLGLGAAFFRSIDLLVCGPLPFGTHFLWHCLLATAAYLAIRLVLRLKMPPNGPVYGTPPAS